MRKKLSFLLPILVLGISLTLSCKKDNVFGDIIPNTERVIVEFTDGKSIGTLAVNFTTQWISAGLTELRFNPRSKVSGEATVKYRLNNTIIADYNSANGTNYLPLPSGAFALEATELTLNNIDKKKSIPIKILPAAITGGAYALGLSILSTTYGEISPVAHDVLVIFEVKNDYEGLYHSIGERILYNGATISSGIAGIAQIDDDKYLYTINQTTVETDVADLIGGAWMFLEIDPVTNNVTVQPSTISPTFLLSNNGPCTYDPATHTFSLQYKYFNAAGNLRVITETMVAK